MFRRSGPGHMLLHTVQKQKVQGRISLSLVKVKVKFTQTEVYKDSPLEKIDPLRSNPAPSPTVPLLHCPQAPPCRDFLLFARQVVMVGKGTRTLLDLGGVGNFGNFGNFGCLTD